MDYRILNTIFFQYKYKKSGKKILERKYPLFITHQNIGINTIWIHVTQSEIFLIYILFVSSGLNGDRRLQYENRSNPACTN
jgi:hypothetical protein